MRSRLYDGDGDGDGGMLIEDDDTDVQGASWGWWGWLEEHLVARVTDLKKEWKGKVRVQVVRTDSFRS